MKIASRYWAYVHENGMLITKPYSGDVKDYTTDCKNNPFVKKVIEPFSAFSYEEARNVAKYLLQRGKFVVY